MNSRAQPDSVRDDTVTGGANAAGTASALEPKSLKYLRLARAVSAFSKDVSTRVGALIVGPAGEIRGTGYNGAPRGCRADEDHRAARPEKYFWFEHAERNAIYNAARCGTPTAGCTLYVTHAPCMDCARAIIQAGVAAVIWPAPLDEAHAARWTDHAPRVLQLLNECGVRYEVLP